MVEKDIKLLCDIGAVLHKSWILIEEDIPHSLEKPKGYVRIQGNWAEDNQPYYVIVPEQLAPGIVKMQNWLANKYNEIEKLKRQLKDAIGFFLI